MLFRSSKDLHSIVTSWNAAAERMFGFAESEMVGQSIRRIIPDDRQQEEDEVLSRIRRGERVEHYETVRRRKNGTSDPESGWHGRGGVQDRPRHQRSRASGA